MFGRVFFIKLSRIRLKCSSLEKFFLCFYGIDEGHALDIESRMVDSIPRKYTFIRGKGKPNGWFKNSLGRKATCY